MAKPTNNCFVNSKILVHYTAHYSFGFIYFLKQKEFKQNVLNSFLVSADVGVLYQHLYGGFQPLISMT